MTVSDYPDIYAVIVTIIYAGNHQIGLFLVSGIGRGTEDSQSSEPGSIEPNHL